jgi:hypothetical protein
MRMPGAKRSRFSDLERDVRGGDRPYASDLPDLSFSLRVTLCRHAGDRRFRKTLIRALNSSSAAKIGAMSTRRVVGIPQPTVLRNVLSTDCLPRYPTLMNWLQKRRKEAGQSEQMAARGDHPRWLEARVEGEVAKSESIVVEMGCGVRLLVANVGQAALAGEVLRAMGSGRGC